MGFLYQIAKKKKNDSAKLRNVSWFHFFFMNIASRLKILFVKVVLVIKVFRWGKTSRAANLCVEVHKPGKMSNAFAKLVAACAV